MESPQEEIVRDTSGKRVGRLQTLADGTIVARDARGNKVGHYDPLNNVTRDARGLKVGQDNQLMWLLTREN